MIKVFRKLVKKKKSPDSSVKKRVVGFYEDVLVNGLLIRAKIDTGASRSSIDSGLADFLGLGPVLGSKAVISSHGRGIRPIVKAHVVIAGKKLNASFNMASRHNLRYPLLIGKNILRKGFIIDSAKRLKKQKQKIIKNTRDLHYIEET
mgnify:CR=1 FL=1